MGMQTGENEQAMRKILDMTRFIGMTILILHFYHFCYTVFVDWGLQGEFSDRLMRQVNESGLFTGFLKSKLFALGFILL